MSLRTGFCCRNVLAQDKIKVHRKLYLCLPHIGILGVPSPNCMLHLQFWDGALLPPAVLGWHLLTCKFFTPSHLQIFHLQYWDGAFSPAVFSGRFFTCSFGMAPSRAAKFTAKKISMESWRFCHNVYTSPVENAKFTENKNDQRNRGINLS